MSQIELQHFVKAIIAAGQELSNKKEDINRLNVFPVPDGDTGTNMSLTIDTVISELSALTPQATQAEVLKAITHGSLMGARGNSGVITSQILRGVCEGLEGASAFDSQTIASAASRSVEVAFNAVRKPVEGTILTVLRDSAEAAQNMAEELSDPLELLKAVATEAMASVRRTPELLPVLKENGVVDAGGFGLAILLESFSAALSGEGPDIPEVTAFSLAEPKVAIEQVDDWDEDSEFLYCTEFLYRAENFDDAAALDYLGSIGDCELLVGASPQYKVHVHTNEPGNVLNYMTERGQVSEVHIHNMRLQSGERAQGIASENASGVSASDSKNNEPQKEIGFIAVASGSGTARILESQDVDFVVRGGQTMNPSTKDFVDAIEQVNAKAIVIFPNNKNIIMAANAAADNVDKTVVVVPTTSVPQSFSALFVVDTTASLEDNVEAMKEAIEEVKTAEITTAIKESKAADGSPIHDGDIIGIAEGKIEVVGSDVSDVALELLSFIAEEADVLTLLAGDDFDDDALEALSERIEEAWPELEIDCQRGEQPLYPLIMAAE